MLKFKNGFKTTLLLPSCEPEKPSLDAQACLMVNPIDMLRTPYWASEGKHWQQPTVLYHPTLTSSSVQH